MLINRFPDVPEKSDKSANLKQEKGEEDKVDYCNPMDQSPECWVWSDQYTGNQITPPQKKDQKKNQLLRILQEEVAISYTNYNSTSAGTTPNSPAKATIMKQFFKKR
jgi:hypothetical protein